MKPLALLGCFGALTASVLGQDSFHNPLIDYDGFKSIVDGSAGSREAHRLSQAEFVDMMSRPGVVVIDARSANRFDEIHVAGAVSLPFTDFTADTLGSVIPSKDTKILIYCNNNFLGAPRSFSSKAPSASLNLSTFMSLRAYGYTQIYELGPLLDVRTTRIPFAGSAVPAKVRPPGTSPSASGHS